MACSKHTPEAMEVGCFLTGIDSLPEVLTFPDHGAYPQHMRLLEALAGAFFRTFGITEPTEQTRRRAAWFILGMFTLVILAFLIGGAILFHML